MAESTDQEMVDVSFQLPGGRLPVDHAYALSSAIGGALPWFADEPLARLHQVHTAASGSGWMLPDAATGEELHLSRRTRLRLRVPAHRSPAVLALSGRTLDVAGYALTPGAGKVSALMPAKTLLARHVLCEDGEDEARLVARINETLRACAVSGASLIFGRARQIATPRALLHTRSLVVKNLDASAAMVLLRNGIGDGGKLGCGICIPYKRID
jgi:CRISPR-associated protein Cas6